MSSFLEALTGLAEGVNTGLGKRRDQNNIEAQRAFQLKKFDQQERRAATMDALNEEVAKSRIALQDRAVKLDEDRNKRELANSEEIPFTTADGSIKMLPRSMVREIQTRGIVNDMAEEGMADTPFGLMSPSDAARNQNFTEEQSANRTQAANRAVQSVYETARQIGVTHRDALKEALSFGIVTYGDIYNEELLAAFESGGQEGEDSVTAALGIGPLGRASLIGAGATGLLAPTGLGKQEAFGVLKAGFAKDPIEGLRQVLFGDKGPQSLEELQALREQEGAAFRSQESRGIAAITPAEIARLRSAGGGG